MLLEIIVASALRSIALCSNSFHIVGTVPLMAVNG
jgi:hypothetical protein